jgi:hypothetical protein
MPRSTLFLLGVLVLVVAGAVFYYHETSQPQTAPAAIVAGAPYEVLSVENPALRLYELDRVRKLEYTGIHRNIFSPTPPPPPPPKVAPGAPNRPGQPGAAQPPPPPPPVVVPATFFGYVTDRRTGRKEAFFSDSDDVYVAGEGDLLLTRFRVLKIGNDSVDIEEISSGRRTTLTLQSIEPTG